MYFRSHEHIISLEKENKMLKGSEMLRTELRNEQSALENLEIQNKNLIRENKILKWNY